MSEGDSPLPDGNPSGRSNRPRSYSGGIRPFSIFTLPNEDIIRSEIARKKRQRARNGTGETDAEIFESVIRPWLDVRNAHGSGPPMRDDEHSPQTSAAEIPSDSEYSSPNSADESPSDEEYLSSNSDDELSSDDDAGDIENSSLENDIENSSLDNNIDGASLRNNIEDLSLDNDVEDFPLENNTEDSTLERNLANSATGNNVVDSLLALINDVLVDAAASVNNVIDSALENSVTNSANALLNHHSINAWNSSQNFFVGFAPSRENAEHVTQSDQRATSSHSENDAGTDSSSSGSQDSIDVDNAVASELTNSTDSSSSGSQDSIDVDHAVNFTDSSSSGSQDSIDVDHAVASELTNFTDASSSGSQDSIDVDHAVASELTNFTDSTSSGSLDSIDVDNAVASELTNFTDSASSGSQKNVDIDNAVTSELTDATDSSRNGAEWDAKTVSNLFVTIVRAKKVGEKMASDGKLSSPSEMSFEFESIPDFSFDYITESYLDTNGNFEIDFRRVDSETKLDCEVDSGELECENVDDLDGDLKGLTKYKSSRNLVAREKTVNFESETGSQRENEEGYDIDAGSDLENNNRESLFIGEDSKNSSTVEESTAPKRKLSSPGENSSDSSEFQFRFGFVSDESVLESKDGSDGADYFYRETNANRADRNDFSHSENGTEKVCDAYRKSLKKYKRSVICDGVNWFKSNGVSESESKQNDDERKSPEKYRSDAVRNRFKYENNNRNDPKKHENCVVCENFYNHLESSGSSENQTEEDYGSSRGRLSKYTRRVVRDESKYFQSGSGYNDVHARREEYTKRVVRDYFYNHSESSSSSSSENQTEEDYDRERLDNYRRRVVRDGSKYFRSGSRYNDARTSRKKFKKSFVCGVFIPFESDSSSEEDRDDDRKDNKNKNRVVRKVSKRFKSKSLSKKDGSGRQYVKKYKDCVCEAIHHFECGSSLEYIEGEDYEDDRKDHEKPKSFVCDVCDYLASESNCDDDSEQDYDNEHSNENRVACDDFDNFGKEVSFEGENREDGEDSSEYRSVDDLPDSKNEGEEDLEDSEDF